MNPFKRFYKWFTKLLGWGTPALKQLPLPEFTLALHPCPICFETLASYNEAHELVCLACGDVKPLLAFRDNKPARQIYTAQQPTGRVRPYTNAVKK